MRTIRSLFHVLAIAAAVLAFALSPVTAQEAATGQTDGAGLISLLLDQLRGFVDLSQVAKTSRNELGNDTNEYLLDIFGRGVTPYCHFIARPLNGKTAGTFSLYLT